MISVATLIAAGITPAVARVFEQPLISACTRFEINTPKRLAHFIGQAGHESLGFTHLEESLWYSRPEFIRADWPTRVINMTVAQSLVGRPQDLANTVYSNRYGNGDKLSGDGWKYIGRGLLQITFRNEYRDCGLGVGMPYEAHPELLAQPLDACLSSAWYWQKNHLNELADAGIVEDVTRVINPQLLGLEDRRARTAKALDAFPP